MYRNAGLIAGTGAFFPAVYRFSARYSPAATALFSVGYFSTLFMLEGQSSVWL